MYSWEPAIYEHKAALIGHAPSRVATSPELLLAALVAEHDLYHADALTVGIDVYNVEAEALGATLVEISPTQCADVSGPLWSLEQLPAAIVVPSIDKTGRFAMLLSVAERLRERLATQADSTRPVIRVAASGPVSIAAKLIGTEDLLVGLLTGEPAAIRLLRFTTEVAALWIRAIRVRELDAIVFDSSASPPMIGPDLYGRVIAPHHRRLMDLLANTGQINRPLILGGDTTMIVSHLISTGANHLICDFAADATAFAAELDEACARHSRASKERVVTVRRNAHPEHLDARHAASFADDLARFSRPVADTGIFPYEFVPDRFLAFREIAERGGAVHPGNRDCDTPNHS